MDDLKDKFYKIDYPVWLALFTKGNHEKKVYNYLKKFNIESFLPTRIIYTSPGKEREIPLFRSYVFVRVIPRTQPFYIAMDAFGAVGYVKFNNVPAIIKDEEIESLKILSENYKKRVFPIYNLSEDEEIVFKRGPLKGVKAKIKEINDKRNLIVVWIKEILAGAALEIKKEQLLDWI